MSKQPVTDAASLAAERQHGAGGHPRGVESVPLGIDSDELTVPKAGLRNADDGKRKVQSSRAAQHLGMPWILSSGSQNRRRVGRGSDPDAGTDVAEIPRVLEQHHWSRLRRGQNGVKISGRSAGDADQARPRHLRRQFREGVRCDDPQAAHQASPHIRGQSIGETSGRVGVSSDERHQLRAEANRVLDGMEALEHGKVGIAASRPEPLLEARQIAQAGLWAEKYASPPSRSVWALTRPASVSEDSSCSSVRPGPNTPPICMSRTNAS